VAWYGKIVDEIGYIQFSGFTENAHQEVRNALNDLKNNHGISKLILDVRGNPGGLLIEAVNVTNLFVEKGQEIVSTKGKIEQWDHTYRARNRPADPEIPIVVLVGNSSASAAEIVAGAIQDLDRGIIIGQRTFGKGLIQTTRQLSYDSQLKITTAKYYTPSGRCIQSLDFSDDRGFKSIHDSLINEFSTKNGRKVYDGGGIRPDIQIVEERASPLVINLYTRNFIFDFATEFASKYSSIPPAA
jgi:carboxyl-terminal processing protease